MKLEKLGPYRVGKRIGKGGMGAVYEAVSEDSGTHAGKRVAIKALSPQLAMAEGFRERFEAEIESLKKLKHEGIVRLLGFGEQDGVLFYSMELVDGPSLEEELNDGRRFDWRETLDFGIQICRALKHAHDHGVVHRDIKPANLMLTSDNRIKIADFGIARLFGGTQLTTAGGVLGTADYMSPEQADGRAVTDRCDQYSLGGVMYALLAGRPPFLAKTMPEMLQLQRFAEPEPVRRYASDTPDQLDRLITQLLAKDPNDRFPNALVLSRHMEAMLKALSRPPKPEEDEGSTTTADFAPVSSDATYAINDHATRDQDAPLILPQDTAAPTQHTNIYDAQTLDQPAESEVPAARAKSPELQPTLASEPPAKPTHFTTVDEFARREREQSQGNLLALAGQLAVPLVALGAIVWGGWVLMKPPTADELFDEISSVLENDEIEDLTREDARTVSTNVSAFLERFPQDSRTEELKPLKEQLEFQKAERSARTRMKYSRGKVSKPLDRLYVEAISAAETNPIKALSQLRALVALYDPLNEITDLDAAESASDQFKQLGDPELLVVARERIQELVEKAKEIQSSQLPALRERFAAATKLRQAKPVQARLMFQAIIELYSDQPWATEIVQQARQALTPSP